MIGMWIIGLLVVACCLHPLVLGFFFSIISSIALAKWGVSVAISRVGPLRMDGVHIVIKSATETKTLKVDTISVATRISSFLMSWFEEHPFRIEILKPTMDIVKQKSAAVTSFDRKKDKHPLEDIETDGIVASIIEDTKFFKRVVALARLFCVNVSSAAATLVTHTNDGGETWHRLENKVTVGTCSIKAVYQATPSSPANTPVSRNQAPELFRVGSIRLVLEVASVEASMGGEARAAAVTETTDVEKESAVSAPHLSVERAEFGLEVDLAQRLVTDAWVAVPGAVRASAGVRDVSALASSLRAPKKAAARSDSQDLPPPPESANLSLSSPVEDARKEADSTASSLPRRGLVVHQRDIPRQMKFSLGSVFFECFDDDDDGDRPRASSQGVAVSVTSVAVILAELQKDEATHSPSSFLRLGGSATASSLAASLLNNPLLEERPRRRDSASTRDGGGGSGDRKTLLPTALPTAAVTSTGFAAATSVCTTVCSLRSARASCVLSLPPKLYPNSSLAVLEREVSLHCDSATAVASPEVLATVCALRGAMAVAAAGAAAANDKNTAASVVLPAPPADPPPPPFLFPRAWPKLVLLTVGRAEVLVRGLHSSDDLTSETKGTGSAPLARSRFHALALGLRVRLEAPPPPSPFASYSVAVSSQTMSGRALVVGKGSAENKGGGGGTPDHQDDAGGIDDETKKNFGSAEAAKRTAVASGQTARAGAGFIEVRFACPLGVEVDACVDGRLRERVDRVHLRGGLQVEEVVDVVACKQQQGPPGEKPGALDENGELPDKQQQQQEVSLLEVLRCERVTVTSASPGVVDLRKQPVVEFGPSLASSSQSAPTSSSTSKRHSVTINWSAVIQLRLLRIAVAADSSQRRIFAAAFPPKNGSRRGKGAHQSSSVPVAVTVLVGGKGCGGVRAILHGDQNTKLIVTTAEASLEVGPARQSGRSGSDDDDTSGEGEPSSFEAGDTKKGGAETQGSTVVSLLRVTNLSVCGEWGGTVFKPPLLRAHSFKALRTLTTHAPAATPSHVCTSCGAGEGVASTSSPPPPPPLPPLLSSSSATTVSSSESFAVEVESVRSSLPAYLELGDLLDVFLQQDSAAALASAAAKHGLAALDKEDRTSPPLGVGIGIGIGIGGDNTRKGAATVTVASPPARWSTFTLTVTKGLSLRVFGPPPLQPAAVASSVGRKLCDVSCSGATVNSWVIQDPAVLARELRRLDEAVPAMMLASNNNNNNNNNNNLAFGRSCMGSTLLVTVENVVVRLPSSSSSSSSSGAKNMFDDVVGMTSVEGNDDDNQEDLTSGDEGENGEEGRGGGRNREDDCGGGDEDNDDDDVLLSLDRVSFQFSPVIVASLAPLPNVSISSQVALQRVVTAPTRRLVEPIHRKELGTDKDARRAIDWWEEEEEEEERWEEPSSYAVVVVQSRMPTKLYLDLAVSVDKPTLSHGAHFLAPLADLATQLSRLSPSSQPKHPPPPTPNKQTPSSTAAGCRQHQAPNPMETPPGRAPPLAWWDNLRHMVHGSVRVAATDATLRMLLNRNATNNATATHETSDTNNSNTAPPPYRRSRSGSLAPPPPLATPQTDPHERAPLRRPCIAYHAKLLEAFSAVADPATLLPGHRQRGAEGASKDNVRGDSEKGDRPTETWNASNGTEEEEGGGSHLRDVRSFTIDSVTISVPNCRPSEWHAYSQKERRTRHHLLALVPRIQASVVLDWHCDGTSPYSHHVQRSEAVGPSLESPPTTPLSPFSSGGGSSSDGASTAFRSLTENSNGCVGRADRQLVAGAADDVAMVDLFRSFRSRSVGIKMDVAVLGPSSSSATEDDHPATSNTASNAIATPPSLSSTFAATAPPSASTFSSSSSSTSSSAPSSAASAAAASMGLFSGVHLESDIGLWASVRMDLLGWLHLKSAPTNQPPATTGTMGGKEQGAAGAGEEEEEEEELEEQMPGEEQYHHPRTPPLTDLVRSWELNLRHSPLFVAAWEGAEQSALKAASTGSHVLEGLVLEVDRLEWVQRKARRATNTHTRALLSAEEPRGPAAFSSDANRRGGGLGGDGGGGAAVAVGQKLHTESLRLSLETLKLHLVKTKDPDKAFASAPLPLPWRHNRDETAPTGSSSGGFKGRPRSTTLLAGGEGRKLTVSTARGGSGGSEDQEPPPPSMFRRSGSLLPSSSPLSPPFRRAPQSESKATPTARGFLRLASLPALSLAQQRRQQEEQQRVETAAAAATTGGANKEEEGDGDDEMDEMEEFVMMDGMGSEHRSPTLLRLLLDQRHSVRANERNKGGRDVVLSADRVDVAQQQQAQKEGSPLSASLRLSPSLSSEKKRESAVEAPAAVAQSIPAMVAPTKHSSGYSHLERASNSKDSEVAEEEGNSGAGDTSDVGSGGLRSPFMSADDGISLGVLSGRGSCGDDDCSSSIRSSSRSSSVLSPTATATAEEDERRRQPSLFFFADNHLGLRPPLPSLPPSHSQVLEQQESGQDFDAVSPRSPRSSSTSSQVEAMPPRSRRLSSVGSIGSSNNGTGRRGSIIDFFAGSLLSSSANNTAVSPIHSLAMSPSSSLRSHSARSSQSNNGDDGDGDGDDDSSDEVDEFRGDLEDDRRTEFGSPLGRQSIDDEGTNFDFDPDDDEDDMSKGSGSGGGSGEEDDEEEVEGGEEEEEPLLRTDVEVLEMRCCYTLPARDRLMLFVELWQRTLTADGEDEGNGGADPRRAGEGGDATTLESDSGANGDDGELDNSSGGSFPLQQTDRLAGLFLKPQVSTDTDENSRSGTPPQRKSPSAASLAAEKAQAASAAASSAHATAAAATFESTIRYRVKFVNPQVSLICPKTRGAVIVGVAEGTLVGRDLGVFYCCPCGDDAAAAPPPGHRAGVATAQLNGTGGGAAGLQTSAQGLPGGRGKRGGGGGGHLVYRKHERLLDVKSALAYVMFLDVEVDRGVCWLKDVKDPSRNAGNVLLHQLMKPFDVRERTEAFSPVTRREWAGAVAAMTAAVHKAIAAEAYNSHLQHLQQQQQQQRHRHRHRRGVSQSSSPLPFPVPGAPPPALSSSKFPTSRRSSLVRERSSSSFSDRGAASATAATAAAAAAAAAAAEVAALAARGAAAVYQPPLVPVRSLAERVRVEMGDLRLGCDSNEFEVLSEAVQDLLLAPPYESQTDHKPPNAAEDEGEGEEESFGGLPGGGGGAATSHRQSTRRSGKASNKEFHEVDLSEHGGKAASCFDNVEHSKDARYALKAVVEAEMASLHAGGLGWYSGGSGLRRGGTLRVIEYTLGKCSWELRPLSSASASSSASSAGAAQVTAVQDRLEIGFSGLAGSHRFLRDQSIESVITLEAAWLLNTKPGPHSLQFADPTLIVKPARDAQLLCKHCFEPFSPEDNSPTACPCHANDWGEDGFFTPTSATAAPNNSHHSSSLRSSTTSATSNSNSNAAGAAPADDIRWCEWTCCGGKSLRGGKCSSRRHSALPGSNMVMVRATQTKPMLVGGMPVKVFSELQVSLFPEARQTLAVQLTADVASFIHAYFFPNPNTTTAGRTAGARQRTEGGHLPAARNPGESGMIGSFDMCGGGGGGGSAAFLQKGADGQRRTALKSPFSSSVVGGLRELTQNESSSDEEEEGEGFPSGGRRGGEQRGQAAGAVYLKFCRIGEVALELTTVGFGKRLGVQLDRQRLPLNSPSFHRSERVVTWGQLGQKYVKHIISNLITSRSLPSRQLAQTSSVPYPIAAAESVKSSSSAVPETGDSAGGSGSSNSSSTPRAASSSSSSSSVAAAAAVSSSGASTAPAKAAKGVRGAAASILHRAAVLGVSRKDKGKLDTPVSARDQRENLLFGTKR